MNSSGLFTLQSMDFIKGAVIAALTVMLGGILQILQNNALPTVEQLKVLGITGLTAAIAYIIKNFFSNNQGTMLVKDVPVQEVKKDAPVSNPFSGK